MHPARLDALPDGHKTRPGGWLDQHLTRGGADVQGEWDHGNPRRLPESIPEAGFRPLDDAGHVPHKWFSSTQLRHITLISQALTGEKA